MVETLRQSSFAPEQTTYPGRFTNLIEKSSFPVAREQFRKGVHELVSACKGDIVLTAHTRPDEDAVCSALAQKRIFQKQFPEKKFKVVFSDKPISDFDRLLETPDEITWAATETKKTSDGKTRPGDVVDHVKAGDVLYCLDQGTYDKFSKVPDELSKSPPFHTVILDHHRDQPSSGSIVYVEPEANATCELLAKMYGVDHIDPKTAELLYLGISSDTRDFTFNPQDFEGKALLAQLLAKTGKTSTEVKGLIVKGEQTKLYEKIFEKHTTPIARPGMPTATYSYITLDEMKPTVPTSNPDHNLLIARRDYMFNQSQEGKTELYWNIRPVASSKYPGRYSLMLRRRNDSTIDLHSLAKMFGDSTFGGGGHAGAASGNFILNEIQIKFVDTQKRANPEFNEMEYVGGLIADKVQSLFAPEEKKAA